MHASRAVRPADRVVAGLGVNGICNATIRLLAHVVCLQTVDCGARLAVEEILAHPWMANGGTGGVGHTGGHSNGNGCSSYAGSGPEKPELQLYWPPMRGSTGAGGGGEMAHGEHLDGGQGGLQLGGGDAAGRIMRSMDEATDDLLAPLRGNGGSGGGVMRLDSAGSADMMGMGSDCDDEWEDSDAGDDDDDLLCSGA